MSCPALGHSHRSTISTDTSSVFTTTESGSIITSTVVLSPSSSPTSTGSPITSPGQNIGAIVGGIVAGVGILVLATVSLICYRRYKKRRTGGQSPSAEVTAVDPFVLSRQIPPTPSEGISLPNQQMPTGFPPTEVRKPTCHFAY